MQRKNAPCHQQEDDRAGFSLSLDKLNIRLGGNSRIVILIAILSGLNGQVRFLEYKSPDSVLLFPEEKIELPNSK